MGNYVYIAASIDGFIAKKDGSINWLTDIPNPDKSDFGYGEFISSIDALVMGKNTFDMVMSFDEWPYTKPVFVASSSLKEIPEKFKDKSELISGTPPQIVSNLNSRGFHNLYIDGGRTIQEFLKFNLINEVIITRIPILLGDGIPLFGQLDTEQTLEHIKSEIYPNGFVKSHYRIKT